MELLDETMARPDHEWSGVPAEALIAHLLQRFHARHRQQLPELIRLASRVEQVHGESPGCPLGLADHLMGMQQELESHMMKEEQILFPALLVDPGICGGPIAVMRAEHDDHGASLARLMQLTGGLALPEQACDTWRALYAGLAQLREDLLQHIHLENDLLFEAAAPSRAGA